MKFKHILFLILLVIAFSCSPKVFPPTPPIATSDAELKVAIVLNENQKLGKNLYEANCAKCHDLFAPSAYSKEKWIPILKRMQANTDLNDVQTEQIYDYLTNGM